MNRLHSLKGTFYKNPPRKLQSWINLLSLTSLAPLCRSASSMAWALVPCLIPLSLYVGVSLFVHLWKQDWKTLFTTSKRYLIKPLLQCMVSGEKSRQQQNRTLGQHSKASVLSCLNLLPRFHSYSWNTNPQPTVCCVNPFICQSFGCRLPNSKHTLPPPLAILP